jgi:hypothetical protein
MIVMGWSCFGVATGITLGGLFWWAELALAGKRIAQALTGEVEDAFGMLQGVVILGCLIGAGVGLAYGLGATDDSDRKPPDRLSTPPG